jgi:ankyrin repeat protein
MLAAQKGTRVCELLIADGADVNRQREDGNSALSWAAASGNVGAARLLLDKGAKPDLLDQNRTTPLLLGAQNADIVQTLLNHGANPNSANKTGFTHLMLAAMNGNLESIQLLTEHGANINTITQAGRAALLEVVWLNPSDFSGIARYLLAHGADPNIGDRAGTTPLFLACRPNGEVETVRLLLQHKAQINVRDRQGDTPLHEAVGNVEYDEEPGNPEIVRLLLAHGANTRLKNKLGYTPLMKTPKSSPAIRRLLQAAEH